MLHTRSCIRGECCPLKQGFGVLVVDLDGTLLRSDMLYESFWSAWGRDWHTPFVSAAALSQGRAHLKRQLAQRATLDAASLPYDADVIAYIEAWRSKGGRTALVTASDAGIARDIAAHVGLFDEVHGSDGHLNLKGANKGAFLEDRFGAKGFAYMGDAPEDVEVWRHAAKAITVNAPDTLRRAAENVTEVAEHLTTQTQSLSPYLKAVRPHQWLKNMLVFLPMLAAHQLTGATLAASFVAFVAFCLVASSVYVLNDLLDLAADRAHPRKCKRPFASGALPLAHGTWMAGGLLFAGGALAIALGGPFLLVLGIYFGLTTAYSLALKRYMMVDICVLAALYTIRIVAGGAATGIPLSVWLLAFSMYFFLSLAAVKRQAELVDSAQSDKSEVSGRGYLVNDLPIVAMVAMGSGYVSVLILALYLTSPAVLDLYAVPEVFWGVCAILLYWVSRTVMLAHRGEMHDDPVVYAVKDRVSQICFVLIFVFVLGGALL